MLTSTTGRERRPRPRQLLAPSFPCGARWDSPEGDVMRRQILRAALWTVLVGCGGASTPPAQQPVQPMGSAGEETSAPSGAVEPAPAPSSPATLTVVTKV